MFVVFLWHNPVVRLRIGKRRGEVILQSFIHGQRVIHVLSRSVTRGPIEEENVGRSVGRMWMFDSTW